MSSTAIPRLGTGLGFRDELADQTFAARDDIDFVEIVVDNYLDGPAALDRLRAVMDVFPVVIPHGLELSIGSAGPLDAHYLDRIRRVSEVTGSPYYSDHLCLTRAPGIGLGHMAPLWFTRTVLRAVVDRVNAVQDALGKPLVLENMTYPFDIPGADLTQPEFFHELVNATGCGVLLDVTNVYTNAVNHDFDPVRFLADMPLDSVVQVHLAGGVWHEGTLVDSHSHPVPLEVWDLFAWLCERVDVKAAMVEFDQQFPEFSVVLDQVRTARELMSAAGRSLDAVG